MPEPLRGARLGSAIGAVGGLVFVLVNAGSLPGQAATVARVVAVLGFAAVLWFAVLRAGGDGPVRQPTGLRTYVLCVVGEVVAIPAGAAVLNRVGLPGLVLPWVVIVVGVHFLPFASAFGVPLFRALGLTLVTLGLVGAVAATVTGAETPGGWCAVAAGFALLGFAFAGRRQA